MTLENDDANTEVGAERVEEVGQQLEGGEFNEEPKDISYGNQEDMKQSTLMEEAKDSGDEEDELPSRCYEKCVSKRCCSFCITRFPKTCAIFVGILVPLFALTVLSALFGGFLCELESPGEIDLNNQRMASTFLAASEASLILNMTSVLPRACYATYLYQLNETEIVGDIEDILRAIILPVFVPSPDSLVGPDGPEVFIEENRDSLFEPPSILINSTDLFIYMSDCGNEASAVIEDRLAETIVNVARTASTDLTFNWIRCYEGAEAGSVDYRGNELTAEQRSQQGQAQVYNLEWNSDRESLFRLYFSQFLEDGESPVAAFVNASSLSVEEASGGGTCAYNGPAGAWFWFITQTTVGYGNVVASTSGGRAMVFTLGFVSILAFAGILASSGYILSKLFDDFVNKHGMKRLSKPLYASLFWGTAYYLWMVVIAGIIISWKEARLGIDFAMGDAYWLSYISTTTVGYGDLFLEAEGLIGADTISFPLLFLVGFLVLSAFLGKFAELVLTAVKHGRKSFVDTLLEKNVNWSEALAKEAPKQK